MVEIISDSKDLPKGVAVVDFFATWCGPCMRIKGAYADLYKEYPDVEFFKCDVDENEEFVKENDIAAMPTFVVYENGKEIDRMEGADIKKLRAMIDKHV